MKKKSANLIILFIIIIHSSTLLLSCKKDEIKQKPILTTSNVINISSTTATSGGNITSDGGEAVKTRGVCWSIGTTPTISDSKTINGAGAGNFTSEITGLNANCTYFIRAYATTNAGTGYGMALSFTTLVGIPSLTTKAVSSLTGQTATSGGEIINDGGASIIIRGVCWNKSSNPTTANQKTSDGSGVGSFTSNLTNLESNTTYYLRAYASNNVGTAYGNEISFTNIPGLPTITTTTPSSITINSASSGGNILNDGGTPIINRGVCWSTSTAPKITDNKTIDGAGNGIFTSSITGLSISTTYYLRAYATNSFGTAYGNEISFSTPKVPILTTQTVTSITKYSALSGGNISDDGGAIISNRGVCWSLNSTPTISDNKTMDGTGTGVFSSSITGLSAGTVYYVRAFATNSAGTAYGNEVSFTSNQPTLPTITSIAPSLIQQTSVKSGGNITDNGGAAITSRGVCWSTNSTPTINDNLTSDGTGTGAFTSEMISLNPNTSYFVRAYATNIVGTNYGNELLFKTATGTVTDVDGNVYYTVTIGSQEWIMENLKTTKYRNGEDISFITDNSMWSSQNTGAYCWYNNDATTNKSTFGALYNYYAIVDSRNLCPSGWHIPTDTEWTSLETYLGGSSIAGGKLKSTIIWNNPNVGANNSSGFSALPGGYREVNDGSFNTINQHGWWWSATVYNTTSAYYRIIYNTDPIISTRAAKKGSGFSARCIKD